MKNDTFTKMGKSVAPLNRLIARVDCFTSVRITEVSFACGGRALG